MCVCVPMFNFCLSHCNVQAIRVFAYFSLPLSLSISLFASIWCRFRCSFSLLKFLNVVYQAIIPCSFISFVLVRNGFLCMFGIDSVLLLLLSLLLLLPLLLLCVLHLPGCDIIAEWITLARMFAWICKGIIICVWESASAMSIACRQPTNRQRFTPNSYTFWSSLISILWFSNFISPRI